MTTQEFTINELAEILRAAAGVEQGVSLGAEIIDVPFDELGYDSLALLETGSRIQRERGIVLTDSVISEAQTPRDLLAAVNKELAAASAA